MEQSQVQPTMQPGQAPAYPPQVPISSSDVAPVPESPEGVPIPQEGLSQEQMRANLEELMSKVQAGYQNFSAEKTVSDEKVKEEQDLALRQVFDLLQSYGIDPNNIEQVGAFLDQIKQTDPETFQLIEKSLKILLGGDIATQGAGEVPPEATGEVPPENMNINTNEEIPQNI